VVRGDRVDKVIATGLLLMAAVISAVLMFNVGLKGVMDSTDGLSKANAAAADRMKTRVRVVYAYGDTATDEIVLYAKNIGRTTLHPVDNSEIFLISPSQGIMLPYGGGGEYWSYSILDAGGQSTGQWSPNVTTEFTLHLTTLDTGRQKVILVTPNGAKIEHELDVY
jgi:hypothetical protein